MPEQEGPATTTRCPRCGCERDLGAPEPITHCEWCGAEYPIPGEAFTPGEETQTGQDTAERADT
jgi:hypothetical protein